MKKLTWKIMIAVEIIVLFLAVLVVVPSNVYTQDEFDTKVEESFLTYVGAECDFQKTGEEDGAFLYEGTIASGEKITARAEYRNVFGKYNLTHLVYEMADGEGSASLDRVDVWEFLRNMVLILVGVAFVIWGSVGYHKRHKAEKDEKEKPEIIRHRPLG